MSNLTQTLAIVTPTTVAVFRLYLDYFGEVLAVTPVFLFDVRNVTAEKDRVVIDTDGHESDCACPECEAEVLRDMEGDPIELMEPVIGFLECQPRSHFRLVN